MSTGAILSTFFKHEIHEKDERGFKAADTAAIQQVGGVILRKSFLEASAVKRQASRGA